jgi:hypothetical protein
MSKPTPEKDTMIMHHASVSRTVGLVSSGKLILTVITPSSRTAHCPAWIPRGISGGGDFQREASLTPSLSLPKFLFPPASFIGPPCLTCIHIFHLETAVCRISDR